MIQATQGLRWHRAVPARVDGLTDPIHEPPPAGPHRWNHGLASVTLVSVNRNIVARPRSPPLPFRHVWLVKLAPRKHSSPSITAKLDAPSPLTPAMIAPAIMQAPGKSRSPTSSHRWTPRRQTPVTRPAPILANDRRLHVCRCAFPW